MKPRIPPAQPPQNTTVFYDGSCPLCRKEIHHYQRLDTSNKVEWLDISCDTQRLNDLGITQQEAMAELHVLNTQGELHTRANAFVAMWAQIPGYRHFGRIVSTLKLIPLMNKIYDAFAKRRYKHWLKRQQRI